MIKYWDACTTHDHVRTHAHTERERPGDRGRKELANINGKYI